MFVSVVYNQAIVYNCQNFLKVIVHVIITDQCIVCVEVLRPSQPNRVMSSAVSLPNHTFTGQA